MKKKTRIFFSFCFPVKHMARLVADAAIQILLLISSGERGKIMKKKMHACVVFIKIATPFKNISKKNTNLLKPLLRGILYNG